MYNDLHGGYYFSLAAAQQRAGEPRVEKKINKLSNVGWLLPQPVNFRICCCVGSQSYFFLHEMLLERAAAAAAVSLSLTSSNSKPIRQERDEEYGRREKMGIPSLIVSDKKTGCIHSLFGGKKFLEFRRKDASCPPHSPMLF